MSLVSLSVKNDRTLNGYIRFGAIRTTTLRAYPKMNKGATAAGKINCSYHNRGQHNVIMAHLASQETLKDSERQLRIDSGTVNMQHTRD